VPAVEVLDLVVRYGPVVAVDGVSFSAAEGSVLALLGPNGAGKTTTVETLEGYRRPSAGTVRVLGSAPGAVKDRIGVMLQRGGVYPSMNARQVLRLFSSFYPSPAPVDELLALVGLEGRVASTPWRRLSGGEQQRVSLALALVGRPSVAFLDEPTAGMDPAARQVLWGVVRSLRDSGACVVLTTHYLEEAERLADWVVILDGGRVVASGTPASLMSAGGGVGVGVGASIRFGAAAGLDVVALGSALGGVVVEERPGEYVAAVAATPDNVAALTAWLAARGVPLADLRAGRQSLEDVFLRLTQGPGSASGSAS